jgi:iron complex transport system ATP-binding protein
MLKVNNLTCGYEEKTVLYDISFDVARGSITGIIGPNGSGKTTLLRALTKIIKAKSGNIYIEGENINSITAKDMAKKIAVVSQSTEGSYMSVEEFVLLGRIPYYNKLQFFETKDDVELACKFMEMTDTLRLKDHAMEKISGGERQLAFIARALCQDTEILLLDEPTSHLDITHQIGILDLIKRLNSKFGLTVVMVLHDLNLDGHSHTSGTPKEVLTYENIEDVYKTVVVVKENPISLKPHVLAISEEARNRKK